MKLLPIKSRRSGMNIVTARAQVQETINKPARLQLVDTLLENRGYEYARNASRLEHLRGYLDGLEGHPGLQPGADIESRGNIALATTFAAGGLLMQWVVNSGAFGQYGPAVVIGSAIGAELGFGSIGYGILRSINNRVRPEATLRIGKVISLAATASLFVAGAFWTYMRFATGSTSERLFDAAAGATWWLAEVAPLCSGLWLGLAHLRSYPSAVAEEIRDIEQRQADLTKFAAWLNNERDKIEPRAPEPAPDVRPVDVTDANEGDDDAAGGALPVKVAGVLLALSLTASMASAQLPCGVASERTQVGLPAARTVAITRTVEQLNDFVARRGCRAVVVSSFTDGGAFTTQTQFNVPVRARLRDCTKLQPVKVDSHHAGIAVFGGYQAHLQQKAKQQCVAVEARADSVYRAARSRFQIDVRNALAQPVVPLPVRTDIVGQIASFREVGIRDVLLVTTGIDTSLGIPDALPSDVRVVIVMFEARESFLGKPAQAAAMERWRRAGAIVVTAEQLTPGIWTRLLAANSGS